MAKKNDNALLLISAAVVAIIVLKKPRTNPPPKTLPTAQSTVPGQSVQPSKLLALNGLNKRTQFIPHYV